MTDRLTELHDLLGITDLRLRLRDVQDQLTRMETVMANESEQINQLATRFDEFMSDVRAQLARLEAERDNLGADGQAALDALTARLDAAQAEIGDADGSDTPTQPGDGQQV